MHTTSRWSPLRWHMPRATPEETDQTDGSLGEKSHKVSVISVKPVSKWPQEARPLKRHTWITFLYGFGDLLLVLTPIYFILLGIAVLTLHGKPTKNNTFGKKVEFAMELGPTIFPIMFAAISGRSMKMIARFMAERGAKLSTLELLMASQSVWGTVESQFLMQRLTLVGANLLFLWTLSPLGGQASLHLMNRSYQTNHVSMKLRYMSTGPATAFLNTGDNVGSKMYAQARALYSAALLAPQSVKLGPQDTWGNVKIPSLDMLNPSKIDPEGWVKVPSQILVPEIYSSLVGIPIIGLPAKLNSSFTLEYNYLSVSCAAFEPHRYPIPYSRDGSDPKATNYTKLFELVPAILWRNTSGEAPSAPFDPVSGKATFMIETTRGLGESAPPGDLYTNPDISLGRLDGFVGHYNDSRLSKSERSTPRELVFASIYSNGTSIWSKDLNIAKCLLYQHHVEAAVECTGHQCATSKLRKSTTDTRPTALTGFEYFGAMYYFVREFPTVINFSEGSSPTEWFMANTSRFSFIQSAAYSLNEEYYVNLSKISPDVFSQRFSLVLNTFYQLSSQPPGYIGDLTSNLSAYGPDTLPVTDINAYLPANLSATEHSLRDWFGSFLYRLTGTSPFLGATTTADTTSMEEIFVCSYPWLALLLGSSVVILVTGGVAFVLKRRTLGPEMFGFVTSMTYENPWVKIPRGGTTLDAMERARLLKDVEVHIGDVRGDEDTGHIAFAAGVPLRKLERGRLYT